MADQQFASIDDYIGTFPAEVRTGLEQVRQTVRTAVPDADETISYDIPTVTLDGRRLLHFAGWKHHLSVYPAPTGDDDLVRRLEPYRSGKGTLKFPLSQPIPYDLIGLLATRYSEQRPGLD